MVTVAPVIGMFGGRKKPLAEPASDLIYFAHIFEGVSGGLFSTASVLGRVTRFTVAFRPHPPQTESR